MKRDISKSIDNVEGREKISGEAIYTSDITMEGMLYAKTIRSTIAKGRIRHISIPSMPKGYYTVDAADIPAENYVHMLHEDWPVFAENSVNHIGEPIMLIVGPDKEVIKDIVGDVKITYDEQTPVFDLSDSHKALEFTKGNPKHAFKKAHKIITYDYETSYQEQTYIEPQGFIGYPENDGVTLIGSIQCPYYVKNAVKTTMGMDDDKVRVIQAAVGGAFGGKEEYPSLIGCQLAVAVAKVGKPIKLVFEREEDMEVTTKRHPAKIHMEAAVDETGHIRGIRSHIGIDGGAYMGLSQVVLSRGMLAVTNAYTIDHVNCKGDVYLTNTVPNGAFRGFGAPQMIFAIEMFINHIAEDLGENPLEYKMRHMAAQGDLTATGGVFRDPILLNEMLETIMEDSAYHEKHKAYQDPDVFKGIGMSWFLHGCGFTGSGEQEKIRARIRLKKDDKDDVHILIAAVDMGQGPKTTMRKLVASLLEIPIENVHFKNPDTRYVTDSGPTVASRTMMVVGGLVARATRKLSEQWVSGQELVVEESYRQPDYVKWDQDTMTGDAYPAYSWGINVTEVAVDPNTYEVKVKDMWNIYDVGKAIDERVVLGQADGGQAQAVGYATLEKMEHNAGKLLQKNLTDYIIPTAADTPRMHNKLIDNPYPLGPYGAKGAGELTLVGGAPSVALAIEQAIGRRIYKIPATPEHLMELMNHEDH